MKFLSSLLNVLAIDEHDTSIFDPSQSYSAHDEPQNYHHDDPDSDNDHDHHTYEDDEGVKTEFIPEVNEGGVEPKVHESATPCKILDYSNDNRLKYLCKEEDPLKSAISLVQKVIQTKRSFSEPMLLLGYFTVRNSFDGSEEFVRNHLNSEVAQTCPADFSTVSGICSIRDILDESFRHEERQLFDIDNISKQIREVSILLPFKSHFVYVNLYSYNYADLHNLTNVVS